MTDQCSCMAICSHDFDCLGGHANFPNDHWYLCMKCTKWSKMQEIKKALTNRKAT